MARPRTGVQPVGYCRAPAEVWSELDKIAAETGVTRSAVMVDALRRHIRWYQRQARRQDEDHERRRHD